MSARSWRARGAIGLTAAVMVGLAGCAHLPPPDLAKAYADARAVLDRGLTDADAFTRSHTIEALAETVGPHAGKAYEHALADPYPPVRFAAAMAIGDTQYAAAKGLLLQMAGDKQLEPDRRVMPAIIYALYRLGDNTNAEDLYPLLFDPEREVRANAALAMGKMGEPSGIGPLKTRLNDEQDQLVRLEIIESLALLGDSASALGLESYTKKTPFMDERLVAIPAMARVRSTTAPQVLEELLDSRQPPRVRVSAAGALGMLGKSSPTGYELCRRAAMQPQKVLDETYGGRRAGSEQEVGSLQRLAAISLGWMGNEAAVADLQPLLDNADGAVRAAAAMSILRLLPAYQRPLPPSVLTTEPEPLAPVPGVPVPAVAAPVAAAPVAPEPVAPPPAPPVVVVPPVEPAAAEPSAPAEPAPLAAPPTARPSPWMKLRTAGGKD